jgi:Leucine-rich repeat (LRR) protein
MDNGYTGPEATELLTTPPRITKFNNRVIYADFSYLNITNISSEIGRLSGSRVFQKFYLDHNSLTTIPAEIGQISSLRTLRLDTNQITSLPDIFSTLNQPYFSISLASNQLSVLPPSLWAKKPGYASVSYNKICNPTPSQIAWFGGQFYYDLSRQSCGSSLEQDKITSFCISYSPNPFSSSMTISYTLPERANVSISVYSIQGLLIKTLVSGSRPAGSYSVQFGDVKTGAYVSRAVVGSKTYTQKLLVVR